MKIEQEIIEIDYWVYCHDSYVHGKYGIIQMYEFNHRITVRK